MCWSRRASKGSHSVGTPPCQSVHDREHTAPLLHSIPVVAASSLWSLCNKRDNYKVMMRGLYRKERARRGIANAEPGGEEEDEGVARCVKEAMEAVRPVGFEGGGIAK